MDGWINGNKEGKLVKDVIGSGLWKKLTMQT